MTYAEKIKYLIATLESAGFRVATLEQIESEIIHRNARLGLRQWRPRAEDAP